MRNFYEYAIALAYEWAKPLAIGIAFWVIVIPLIWVLHP